MSRERITTSEGSAAVRLPKKILEGMGIDVGDEVEMSLVERTLVVRPLDESERAREIEAASTKVLERRKSAYEELAKGAD